MGYISGRSSSRSGVNTARPFQTSPPTQPQRAPTDSAPASDAYLSSTLAPLQAQPSIP